MIYKAARLVCEVDNDQPADKETIRLNKQQWTVWKCISAAVVCRLVGFV